MNMKKSVVVLNSKINMWKIKNVVKLEIIALIYRCCMCYLKDRLPKKFSIAFHKGSNYGYHFIIKELAEELELAEVNINITTVFLKTQTLKMIS